MMLAAAQQALLMYRASACVSLVCSTQAAPLGTLLLRVPYLSQRSAGMKSNLEMLDSVHFPQKAGSLALLYNIAAMTNPNRTSDKSK